MKILNLFKYYASKFEGEDNLSFYSRGSIYFQKPEKFNDPWDCKAPQITIPRQINSLKNIWFALHKKKGLAFADAEWKKISALPRTEIKKQFEQMFRAAFEETRSKVGVFSLSFIPDSELLWAHYATAHSGYMLHFQIDITQYDVDPKLKNVATPIPVIYKDKREVWDLGNYYNNREKYVYDLIRFKSKAWSYECEFRLLNVNGFGFMTTPSNWLKSIVIGLNTDRPVRENLERIGSELRVPVFSAVMNKKEYRIDIPGLEVDGISGANRYKEIINSKIFEL